MHQSGGSHLPGSTETKEEDTAMLYNYSEVIPFVLFLPVALNIILPLGMLTVYLAGKLILLIMKPVLGKAALRATDSKAEISAIAGAKAL